MNSNSIGTSSLVRPLVVLLSTGLDSPIASYLMMKQGHDLIAISFLNGGEMREKNKAKVLATAKKLVELTQRKILLYLFDYDGNLDQIIAQADRKLTCILCKRTMLFIAEAFAKEYGALGIINGDILGEQASQTLDNLFVVNKIIDQVPVIRPLIGFDKLDVIRISQAIGLYPISLMEGIGCTRNPKYPETHAKLEEVLESEKGCDRAHVLTEMKKQMEIILLSPP